MPFIWSSAPRFEPLSAEWKKSTLTWTSGPTATIDPGDLSVRVFAGEGEFVYFDDMRLSAVTLQPPPASPRAKPTSTFKLVVPVEPVAADTAIDKAEQDRAVHPEGSVKLPKAISSHMVLQRDRPLPIWGWADPGEEVTVKLDAATATATADEQGNWKVVPPAVKADGGKTHSMTVRGKKNTITLDDLLFGDVWLGSGQSNMEWPIYKCHNADEAMPAATDSQVRLLHTVDGVYLVPKEDLNYVFPASWHKTPAKDLTSQGWKVCSPQTVSNFSGVLYFFGQRLRKELNVPVGLVNSSWGGTGE